MPQARKSSPKVLTTTWPPRKSINFTWPVKVGLIEPLLLKEASQGHWAKVLSELKLLDMQRVDLNLVVVSYSNKSLLKLVQLPVTAQAVLILLKPGDEREVTDQTLSETASSIRERTGASAVLFISPLKVLGLWYDEFIIHLSHDQGVITAVRNAGISFGRFFATPLFDEETRLSLFIKELIDKLRTNKYSYQKKFEARLHTGYQQMTLDEAGAYLAKNYKTLVYDHESGPASIAKNMVAAMKKSTVTPIHIKAMPAIVKKKAAGGQNLFPTKGESLGYKGAKHPSTSGVAAKKAVKKTAKKIFKKAARKPLKSQPANTRASATKKEVAARFLQAAFRKKGDRKFEKNFLLPSTEYRLCIKIGETDLQYIEADRSFPTDELFIEEIIKEVVIDLEVRVNTVEKPFHKKLTLPREGDSNTILVPVVTGRTSGFLEAEILACYKNRLLQRGILKIEVRKEKDKPKLKAATLKLESILSSQFNNLEKRTAFDAVVALPAKPDNKKPVAGMSGKKALPFRYTPAMDRVIQKIKSSLETLALTPVKDIKLRDAETIRQLRILANQGSLLYNNYLNRMTLDGPMQLITNNGAYLPIDFAYTLKAPDQHSTLCKHAEKALAAGKCAGCVKNKNEEYKNICPFGFWALSQVIERHEYKMNADSTESDYVLKSDPGKQRTALKIFGNVLHGASNKLNDAQKGLTGKLGNELKKNCKVTLARDWKQWATAVPNDPDSLVLVVHVENNPETEVDALEIGKELLDQNQLDERYIPVPHKGKAPFVILFGCESTNTDAYLFDTVKQLFNNGAAIVVSNFTKILGDQAAAMLIQLVELLKKKPVKDQRFGEVMLRLRQLLVSEGLVGGLSILCHGDTDWKIST